MYPRLMTCPNVMQRCNVNRTLFGTEQRCGAMIGTASGFVEFCISPVMRSPRWARFSTPVGIGGQQDGDDDVALGGAHVTQPTDNSVTVILDGCRIITRPARHATSLQLIGGLMRIHLPHGRFRDEGHGGIAVAR